MSTTFTTPFEQYADREGQEVTILHIFTEPDETLDEEVLPMVLVRFPDGFETEAWPEELEPNPFGTVTASCKYCSMALSQTKDGTWVDDTDGDCCSGDDDLNNENEPH